MNNLDDSSILYLVTGFLAAGMIGLIIGLTTALIVVRIHHCRKDKP